MANTEETLYTGYVYMIYNDVNDKVYIGETLQKITTRFKLHLQKAFYENKRNDTHLARAIRKYGKEHFFVKEIDKITGLDRDLVKKEILNLEILYISKYNSCDNGYNCDYGGGRGAKVPSKETREKQSKIKTSDPKYAEIARENLKKAAEAGKIPITMYNFNTGEKLEEFESTKSAAIKYNKSASDITKICKGKANYLRIDDLKVTFKYSSLQYIPNHTVECYTDNLGLVEKFVEIADAGRKYNVDPSAIIRCCRGKSNSAGKYNSEHLKWRYINE